MHCPKILEVVTSPAPASLTNNLTLTDNHRCKNCRFASILMWRRQELGTGPQERDGTVKGVGTRALSPVCMKPPNAWAPSSHVTQRYSSVYLLTVASIRVAGDRGSGRRRFAQANGRFGCVRVHQALAAVSGKNSIHKRLTSKARVP